MNEISKHMESEHVNFDSFEKIIGNLSEDTVEDLRLFMFGHSIKNSEESKESIFERVLTKPCTAEERNVKKKLVRTIWKKFKLNEDEEILMTVSIYLKIFIKECSNYYILYHFILLANCYYSFLF